MIKDSRIKEWYRNVKDRKKNGAAKILGVDSAHLKLKKGDDLFVTRFGMPFLENLKPENFWTDTTWRDRNAVRLSGTSSVYKIRTKKIEGKGKDIVIKWNRMGQDIPGDEENDLLAHTEFNSPFEEFSLVMDLRDRMSGIPRKMVIQKPLAIYVPSEFVELWQTGRKEYKMQSKIESHKEIALDMHRSYAVIYEWIKGLDTIQAFDAKILAEKYLKILTLDAQKRMEKNGFVVKDNKPHHVIVRPKQKDLLARDREGNIVYGLVDYELLQRTPKLEKKLKKDKRADYLKRQRDRFTIAIPNKFHPHLHHIAILGVEYVYGHVESTKGRLWVAGKDPYLFDYFLPERWENIPKTKISAYSSMYYTVTKDDIHLAWKVSRAGMRPDMDPFKEDERKILEYGYNSPFEEIAAAIELNRRGIPTIYPRAVYMSSVKTEISDPDNSRYNSHKGMLTPDEIPILKKNQDYMVIWGYWNGPDEKLAAKDGDYYEGISVLQAYRDVVITEKQYFDLVRSAKKRMSEVGFEDLNFRGDHLLISFDSRKKIVMDNHGMPEIRVCNFEFLKRVKI
ncbi:MAG: hypothetical protein ABIJ27_03805 [Candidatus Omnitrophota bacterium]